MSSAPVQSRSRLSAAADNAAARELAAMLARPHWRLKGALHEMTYEFMKSAEVRFPDRRDLYRLAFEIASERLDLYLPRPVIRTLLGKLDEEEDLAALRTEDGALLIEHVLTPVLDGLEARFNASLVLREALPEAEVDPSALTAHCALKLAAGKTYPVAIALDSPFLASRIAKALDPLEAKGPVAEFGRPVLIGPVHLSEAEIETLAPGDEILLGVTSFEGLSGIVPHSETLAWPIKLIDGRIVGSGPLQDRKVLSAGGPEGAIALFYVLGAIGEEGHLLSNEGLSLGRIDDTRMALKLDERTLALAKLVKVGKGVALRISSVEQAVPVPS
jgi:hypothetical protein